jgi:hypothetical protein
MALILLAGAPTPSRGAPRGDAHPSSFEGWAFPCFFYSPKYARRISGLASSVFPAPSITTSPVSST